MPRSTPRDPELNGASLESDAVPASLATASGAMASVLERLQRFALSDESIVLLGETGTGKTHLARWLHRQSPRAHRNFVAKNLAGLDDSMASSELFGHVLGAYTDAKLPRAGAFASANGGTVLLDELGKTSLTIQRKLLPVIDDKVFTPLGSDREVRLKARLVFAANESLERLVETGQMLPDLVPRLGYFKVTVPSLREHPEDIPALFEAMVAHYAPRFGYSSANAPRPTPELVQALMAYDWPYNIRELDSLVRRLLAEPRTAELDVSLLTNDLSRYRAGAAATKKPRPSAEDVRAALRQTGGQRKAAAKMLGIGRTSLYRILPAVEQDTHLHDDTRSVS